MTTMYTKETEHLVGDDARKMAMAMHGFTRESDLLRVYNLQAVMRCDFRELNEAGQLAKQAVVEANERREAARVAKMEAAEAARPPVARRELRTDSRMVVSTVVFGGRCTCCNKDFVAGDRVLTHEGPEYYLTKTATVPMRAALATCHEACAPQA